MTPALALSHRVETADDPASTHDAAQVVRHLAHELRQPLSTLESLAYYLDMVLPVTDIKARQQVEKIQQLVQQANWIVDDAVHYLQASPSNPSPVALDEVITQILADRSRGRRLHLHLELGPEPCLAHIDPQQAQHMLTNLLALFRQIAQPETPVSVSTDVSFGESRVRLSCIAPGIGPGDIERQFDPFGQCSPAGAGLALASAKSIVERHRGVLELELAENQRVTLVIRFRAFC
jgi:signal transduction histidine kinase